MKADFSIRNLPQIKTLLPLLGMCFALLSFQVTALELFNSVQIHGFATQGLFSTKNNNIFGDSSDGISPDFTELGINGSWVPLPKLRLSMQIISRRAGDANDGTPMIDFGLLDYSFFDKEDYRIGVRLGRVRLPYGLYNDTRDVAFTRPSILLPQSIYFERTRDLTMSGDGGMIYGQYRHPWGTLTLEMITGFPRTDNSETRSAVLSTSAANGNLQADLSFIGRLNYELDNGRIRFAITGARVQTHYTPLNSVDPLPRGTDVFSPVIFSAQYKGEKLSLTSEYSLRPINKSGFGPFLDYDVVGESYYFQAAYRIFEKWEIMARYDALYNDRDDPQGLELQQKTGIPAYTQYAKDWTTGIRYDVTPWLMIRGEYHYINGTAWLPTQDNPVPPLPSKYWEMFALLVSFRF